MSRRAIVRDGIKSLPFSSPGESVVTLPDPAQKVDEVLDSVAVYAGVNNQPAGVARVDLIAEFRGIKTVVGSAFLPSGFHGVAIVASGFMADAWHVEASATNTGVCLKVGIQSCGCCCGGPDVQIPAELSEFPLDVVAPLTLQDMAPILDQPATPWGS